MRRPIRTAARLSLEPLEGRAVPAGFIAAGSDAGAPAQVQLFADQDLNGRYETPAPGGVAAPVTFSPYPGFTGGVRVATGDTNGDGNDELITAAGPGGGPHVVVWDLNPDGTVGGVVDSFFAYDPAFAGGAFVAAGDLNNDGRDEVITGSATGASHVRVFSDTDGDGRVSDNVTDDIFPFGAFPGGVRVAAGNTNNVGGDELIVAAGPGAGPHVIVFTDADADRAVSDHAPLDSFYAFDPGFGGGVYVAAGRVDGAGGAGAEVIVGTGAGVASQVRVFSDANANGAVADDPPFDEFSPYPGFMGGVRVAAGDTDHSGPLAEVVTGAGPGGGPHVRVFDDSADAGAKLSDNPTADDFLAFPVPYTAGVFLAFGEVRAAAYSAGSSTFLPDAATATASISVPGGAGVVRDLDVSLFVSHTFAGDLDVTLTHVPTGRSVVLFTDVGGTDEGFLVRLSDENPNDIGAADNPTDGPVTGVYNPEGAALLGVFDGVDASGEWRLTVVDDNGGDLGTLLGWTLHVTY